MTLDMNGNKKNLDNKIAVAALVISIFNTVLGAYIGLNQLMMQEEIRTPYDERLSRANDYFDKGEYKKAVEWYDKTLEKYRSSDVLKWKGFALFNLGIDNENVKITRYRAYSYAKELIDYYLSYQPTDISRDYLKRSFQCFEETVYHNPKDSEAWLYKGIVALYLSPSPTCDPIEDFNVTLTLIDNYPYKQKSLPLRDIESYAWYGKCMVYSEIIGQREKAEECCRKANETK